MTSNKTSFLNSLLVLLIASLAVMSLTGCGGPSREEVRKLGTLIDEFNAAYEEAGRQLANGTAKPGYPFNLASYEKQLAILKAHRAANAYKGEIKGHLDALEEGLTEGIKVYRKWINEGRDAKNPPPDEANTISEFAIKLTSAEKALTIAAGK